MSNKLENTVLALLLILAFMSVKVWGQEPLKTYRPSYVETTQRANQENKEDIRDFRIKKTFILRHTRFSNCKKCGERGDLGVKNTKKE